MAWELSGSRLYKHLNGMGALRIKAIQTLKWHGSSTNCNARFDTNGHGVKFQAAIQTKIVWMIGTSLEEITESGLTMLMFFIEQ